MGIEVRLREPPELRFTPRNEELVLLGLKMATTRRSVHGKPADVFLVRGRPFELLAQIPMKLRDAAETCFLLEGESSPTELLRTWAEAYGIRSWTLDLAQPVWVHVFRPKGVRGERTFHSPPSAFSDMDAPISQVPAR